MSPEKVLYVSVEFRSGDPALNILTLQHLCDSYCTMRCNIVTYKRDVRTNSTSKKTNARKANLGTIAGTGDRKCGGQYGYKHDTSANKNSTTSKQASFNNVREVVSYCPVSPYVYTSRITSQTKSAPIPKE